MATKREDKVYKIVGEYKGNNPQILYYKHELDSGKFYPDQFASSYILNNHDFKPIEVNKIVDITGELGKSLQKKYELDFYPSKLYIYNIVGEMGLSWHCYIQYRQSVPPKLAYLPKKDIITQIYIPDYKQVDVDFDYYDRISGRKLKNHQKAGVKFLLANRKSILADGMGLGKTTTCVVTALAGKFNKILIVCPASLKTNWKREIGIYDKEEGDTSIVSGSKWTPGNKFTIVNYDIVDNFYKVPMEPEFEKAKSINRKTGEIVEYMKPVLIRDKTTKKLVQKMRKSRKKVIIESCMAQSPMFNEGFDCVFLDEAQNLSNSGSIRYSTMEDFLKRSGISNIYLVTGTPITNRPMNLFNLLRLIQHPITSDYEYFAMRFCNGYKMKLKTGKEIIQANGSSNIPELMERLKNCYIRRTADDMNDMVKKTVLTYYYMLDAQQMNEYEHLWNEYCEFKQNIDKSNRTDEYQQLIEGGIYRQYLAKQMIPYTIKIAKEILSRGDKVVIITSYQKEMDELQEHFGKSCVVYNGKMTAKAKDKAQDAFMNNPEVKVFIGQIKACGVGITLTIAHDLIFNSFDWVAANNKQAEDRVYRITSTKDVSIYYQMFKGTHNEHMFNTVLLKQMVTDQLIKKEDEK